MVLTVAHTWDGVRVPPSEVVTVRLVAGADLRVEVVAPYHADPPPPGPPGPRDGLWEHEVVEVFVAGPGDDYTEIELSPHGHHLVLTLRGVRQVVARCLPLAFEAKIAGDRWIGTAVLDGGLLPGRPWRVNAYAIHGSPRRYLAHTPLPGPAPDFHQPVRFTTALEPT